MGTRVMVMVGAVAGAMACAGSQGGQGAQAFGPHPILPAPHARLIPTVNVAKAIGWTGSLTPITSDGMSVNAFARNLEHPRWLYVLPNGDVLVAETNAPVRPEDGKGLRGWFFRHYQKKAGGAVPSANRITLLRDTDGDGTADARWVLLEGLNSPFGMALVGDRLYVANTDALVWFPYTVGQTQIVAAATTLVALPAGPLNHHWTKNRM